MAHERNGENKERDKLIAEIRDIQDQLVKLGIKREYFRFDRLKDADLKVLVEVLGNQLERRKKFLRVK